MDALAAAIAVVANIVPGVLFNAVEDYVRMWGAPMRAVHRHVGAPPQLTSFSSR